MDSTTTTQYELLMEEAYQEALSLVGQPCDDRRLQQYNTVATRDAIRHFAWGLGDDNPLWLDESYARSSAVGTLSAPGTFLYTIDNTAFYPGLIDFEAFYVGASWQWFDRVRVDDAFTAKVRSVDARKVKGRRGLLILQTAEISYQNQLGKVVARVTADVARVPSAGKEGSAGYTARRHVYSAAELDDIRRRVLGETRRGSEPRYWEDVSIGDTTAVLTKGPLTLTDMICWYAGGGLGARRAARIQWKEMQVDKEHYRKSADGALGHKGLGHLDPVTAAETGMPGPYDNGWQRVSNVSHLVTDWMGDHGFLKKLSARLVRPNVFGDVWMLSGEVTEKSIVDGESIVYLKISGMNQLGEETTTGVAAVRLPSRNNR